jgi:tetratricopeptide (TPR) repeat protein
MAEPAPSNPYPLKKRFRFLSWEKIIAYLLLAGIIFWISQRGVSNQRAAEYYSQAVAIYNRTPESDPNSADEYRFAINKLNEALRLKPNYPEACYCLGLLQSRVRNWDEAIEDYEWAIRLKPDYAEAFHALGVLYQRIAQPEKAAEAFRNEERLKKSK